MAARPYVRDAAPIYPYAGGGGGSGMGGGGGSVYVGMLADNPDPATYGQWIVTSDQGPWTLMAQGTFALMVSNGSSWFRVAGSSGSGGGGGTDVDEVHVGPTAPTIPFDGQMWIDTSGTGVASVTAAGGTDVDEVHVGSTPPSAPFDGQVWINTSGTGVGARAISVEALIEMLGVGVGVGDLPSQPSGPPEPWADTFDRPDAAGHEAVGNGWTPDPRMLGNLSIVDHCLMLISGSVADYQRYYTDMPGNPPLTGDIAIEVDWPAEEIRWGTGLMCRYDSVSGTGVRCWLTGSGTVELGDSSWYDIGNVPLATTEYFPESWGTSETNTLRLELRGSHASIYANGVPVHTAEISVNVDIADGAIGLCGAAAGRRVQAVRVFPI